MTNENDNLLFETKDPFGRKIVLSSNRYYGHIISSDDMHQAHAEFTPEEIKQTIEKPDAIFESLKPNSDVFFGKTCKQYPSLYLKVPVAIYESDNSGEVITAFLSKNMDGGIKGEEVKYVKRNL